MPNQPATPNRNFRASDDLWDLVQRAADDDGVTLTDVVLHAIVRDMRRRYPYEDVPER